MDTEEDGSAPFTTEVETLTCWAWVFAKHPELPERSEDSEWADPAHMSTEGLPIPMLGSGAAEERRHLRPSRSGATETVNLNYVSS
jgi:hypothetical protein